MHFIFFVFVIPPELFYFHMRPYFEPFVKFIHHLVSIFTFIFIFNYSTITPNFNYSLPLRQPNSIHPKLTI